MMRIKSRPEISLLQHVEQRRRQVRHPGDREQQRDAHDHRREHAHAPRPLLLVLRQLARQDRHEDDVVDAEDDLENGQRDERDEKFSHGSGVHCGRRTNFT